MAESVKVVVRCRPFSEKEKSSGHSCIVSFEESTSSVSITNPELISDPRKKFTFDSVFDWDSEQQNVYNQTALPIVNSVLNGYNGTIFAYGQTGTGKTFSMEGVRDIPKLRGIIPNSFEHIFSHIRTSGTGIKYLVRASYLEIYNEDVRDLLASGTSKLELKEHPDTGIYVKDLSSFVVKDVEEIDKLMNQGNKNRSVAHTEMNARSSRSHSIFTIWIEMSEMRDGKESIRMGKLNLVDLAGSERQSKTGATGDRLKEATKINLSLSCLGNVIKALVDGKSTHVPYRDSKLTRLLQDSLGGNAKTMMIATLSPASYNYDETVSTLRYAARAKNIKNKPKVNEDPKDAMLRMFQEEIQRLKEQLDNHENVCLGVEYDEEPGTESDEEIYQQGNASKLTNEQDRPNQKKHGLTLEEMQVMEHKIQQEKQAILASKDIIETEKQALIQTLEAREDEINAERKMREELLSKLEQMESKLLVGGVNLLDKEAQQRDEITRHLAHVEERKQQQIEIQLQMQQEEEAALQMEEEYNSLQEEALAKTFKIKKMWTILMNHKAELKDSKIEYQHEREDLLDTIRELSRDLKQKMKLVDRFIPEKELQLIESNAEWDQVNEQWNIRSSQYTGYHVRRHLHSHHFSTPIENQSMRQPKTSRSVADDNATLNYKSSASRSWMHSPQGIYLTYSSGPSTSSQKSASLKSSGSSQANYNVVHGNTSSRPKAATLKSGKRTAKSSSISPVSSSDHCSNPTGKNPVPMARGLVVKPRHYA